MIRVLTVTVIVLTCLAVILFEVDRRKRSARQVASVPLESAAGSGRDRLPDASTQTTMNAESSDKTKKMVVLSTGDSPTKVSDPPANALLTYRQAVGSSPAPTPATAVAALGNTAPFILDHPLPAKARVEFLSRRRTPIGDSQGSLRCSITINDPAAPTRIKLSDIQVVGSNGAFAAEAGFDSSGRLSIECPPGTDKAIVAIVGDTARVALFIYRNLRPLAYQPGTSVVLGGESFQVISPDAGTLTLRAASAPPPNDLVLAVNPAEGAPLEKWNDLTLHRDARGAVQVVERLIATPRVGIDSSDASGFVVTRASLRFGPETNGVKLTRKPM